MQVMLEMHLERTTVKGFPLEAETMIMYLTAVQVCTGVVGGMTVASSLTSMDCT